MGRIQEKRRKEIKKKNHQNHKISDTVPKAKSVIHRLKNFQQRCTVRLPFVYEDKNASMSFK